MREGRRKRGRKQGRKRNQTVLLAETPKAPRKYGGWGRRPGST